MPLPLLFLTLQAREARFDVLVKGKKAGVATYRLSDRSGGGRVTRLRMVLADGSVSESLSESDAFGATVRSEDVVRRGKGFTKQTVTYGPRGDASIVVNGGKPIVVTFNGRGNRKDPSETWFRGVVPSPGTWATFLKLDPYRRSWDVVRVTYVGKRGAGYLVRQVWGAKRTDFTLDDHAVPLVFESDAVRLVRR